MNKKNTFIFLSCALLVSTTYIHSYDPWSPVFVFVGWSNESDAANARLEQIRNDINNLPSEDIEAINITFRNQGLSIQQLNNQEYLANVILAIVVDRCVEKTKAKVKTCWNNDVIIKSFAESADGNIRAFLEKDISKRNQQTLSDFFTKKIDDIPHILYKNRSYYQDKIDEAQRAQRATRFSGR